LSASYNFLSVPCLSPEGREIIRDAHAYYTNVLFKTVNEIVGCSQDRVATRLCDLMSLLPAFEVSQSSGVCYKFVCRKSQTCKTIASP
jgi:hypothetical protein